ncbi:MAG: hypothetical protein OEQ53_08720, partial [Saprospiraceae bacterium]|nr:hypothetical protein [Saprospiraceae bacterium]
MTDLELIASQVVKIILFFILVTGVLVNIIKALKAKSLRQRITRASFTILMILLAILVLNWVLVEGSMLRSEKYVIGTTLGFCQVFAQGKGIEFQYQVEGRVYKNCIAPHPIPIDQI